MKQLGNKGNCSSYLVPKLMTLTLLSYALAGCGGGGGNEPDPQPDARYSISGTASGLDGSVVISANTENLIVSQNGSFTFNSSWVSGTTVSLAIEEPPETQECEITPAQVTLGNSNVTNVELSCTDIPQLGYSVDYTLTGNARPITLEWEVNEESYAMLLDDSEGELMLDVAELSSLYFYNPEEAGHNCTVTPNDITAIDQNLTIAISCETFGDIHAYVTDYATGEPLSGAVINVYLFSGDDMNVQDASLYELITRVETDTEGMATAAAIGDADRVVVEASADNYNQRSSVTRIPEEFAAVTVNLALVAVEAEVAFDPTQSATLGVEGSSAAVQLPANAFVNEDGVAVTEEVTARLTRLDASSDANVLPGDYAAFNVAEDSIELFETFGAVSATFTTPAGDNVQLAEDTSAVVRIPVAGRAINPPATVNLVNYNQVSGIWELEGEAMLQTDPETGNLYYEGSVPHFSIWNASSAFRPVFIRGCVEPMDGESLRAIRITGEGQTYLGRSVTYPDVDGTFALPVRPNGRVLVTANSGSGVSNTTSVTVGNSDVQLGDCIGSISGSMRITLTWGEHPRDLDSHFMGPIVPNGTLSSERFRIFYANSMQEVNGVVIDLDVDDTTSYGPEVITVPDFPYAGVYRYAVHHYSGSGTIYESPTRVEVELNDRSYVFSPSTPENTSGSLNTWIVFDLTVSEEGSVSIQRVDTYTSRSESDINPNGINGLQQIKLEGK